MAFPILNFEPRLALASARRSASIPAPWHAQSAARRAAEALNAAVIARSARLRAVLARPVAPNAVAAGRLFTALGEALGQGVPLRRHQGPRHTAVTARALATDGQGGIRMDGLFCMAGKRLNQRQLQSLFDASHHACARFVERSGLAEPVALHNALREAAEHVPAVLVAHLLGGLAHRLRTGTASILLPAGEGAFLGRLRLLPQETRAAPFPAIEICSWVHGADLAPEQHRARDVLRAGLPPATLVEALAEAWASLVGNGGGDRRVREGLTIVPLPPEADRRTRLAIGDCGVMTLARLDLGLVCPEMLVAERMAFR